MAERDREEPEWTICGEYRGGSGGRMWLMGKRRTCIQLPA